MVMQDQSKCMQNARQNKTTIALAVLLLDLFYILNNVDIKIRFYMVNK